jgi:hypothetical protein
VAVLYALGWLAPLIHLAEGPHVWCERHERMEHRVELACEADAPVEAKGPQDRLDESVPEPGASHDACGFTESGPPKSAALPGTRRSVTCSDGLAPPAWVRSSVFAREALYALAPKQSPPTA